MEPDAGTSVIELSEVSKVYETGEVAVQALRSVSLVIREGESSRSWARPARARRPCSPSSAASTVRRPARTSSLARRGDARRDAPRTRPRRAHRLRLPGLQPAAEDERLSQRRTAARVRGGAVAGASQRALAGLGEVGLSDRAAHLPTSSRAASSSASPSPARSSCSRACSCSTSRPATSTPPARRRCSACSSASTAQGATLAMVTHSNEVAERASRIVRLADGAIVSDEQVGGQLAVGVR